MSFPHFARLMKLLIILAALLGESGCGGGGPSGPVTTAVPVPTTAKLIIDSVLQRAIPREINTIRVTGLDSDGQLAFGPTDIAKKAHIELEIPVTVATVRLEYLRAQTVVGRYEQSVDPSSGEVVITDPAWVDVAPPADPLLSSWQKVVNNIDSPPGQPDLRFFSFTQPAVNAAGKVVFRGRAKKPTGQQQGGEPLTGVWTVDQANHGPLITVADRQTLVPPPNSNNVSFTETPSIPRIDMSSSLLATRGNSQPVETILLPDNTTTKAGTTGIFIFDTILQTAIDTLGNFPAFARFQVPGEVQGVKFDVFPGSPAVSDGKYVAFKGNYTLPDGSGKTGVFFRDVTRPESESVLIANSSTLIPGRTIAFGSTAPPSAANGQMVFVGLDNEEAPTAGGIYLAELKPATTLIRLVEIGSPVPNEIGEPLEDGSTFNRLGESLSFDGRYVAFWGAWGSETREKILDCPTDGNKDLIAYCMATAPLPGGRTPVQIPVNQGIFLHDTVTGKTLMVGTSGENEQFHDFLYWVYSGRPPGVGAEGDGDTGEAEPPRWRSSAFMAADGTRGVVFKADLTPGTGVAETGLYSSDLVGGFLTPPRSLVELGNPANALDPQAPANSTVTSVGVERDGWRRGWLVITVGFINPEGESWAGVYLGFVPTP